MITRRRVSISSGFVAFCASISLHAILFAAAVRSAERAGISFYPLPAKASPSDRSPVLLARIAPQPDEQLGADDGKGDATDASLGDESMLARKGDQNQALLSRDPGTGAPVASRAQRASTPAPPREQVKASHEQSSSSEEAEKVSRSQAFGVGAMESGEPTFPIREADKRLAASQTESSSPSNESQNTSDTQSTPMLAAAPGEPAPQGESDSDAFTVEGSVTFRPGSMSAQLGRPHRITTPKIGMAGQVDAVQLGRVSLVLLLQIDATGNVRDVSVYQSSGSSNIDQACRIAAWEWWFKPKADKFGQPRASEKFLFDVSFF